MIKILITLVTFACLSKAYACSPMRTDPNIEDEWYRIQEFLSAQLIFRGKVIKTRLIKEDTAEYQYSNIDVYEDYKGQAPLEVITKSALTCCMCGQELHVGIEYIFYVNEAAGDIYEFSSYIVPIDQAQVELDLIKKIQRGDVDPVNAKMSSYIKINYPPKQIHNKRMQPTGG